MKLPRLPSIYNVEQVRQLLELAEGQPRTAMDVHNLLRRGKLLELAYISGGAFDRRAVNTVMTAILRRRLARDLGRISPRLLDLEHSIDCPECGGVAVSWEARWKCENGHAGLEPIGERERAE